jgi:hypothetical protein
LLPPPPPPPLLLQGCHATRPPRQAPCPRATGCPRMRAARNTPQPQDVLGQFLGIAAESGKLRHTRAEIGALFAELRPAAERSKRLFFYCRRSKFSASVAARQEFWGGHPPRPPRPLILYSRGSITLKGSTPANPLRERPAALVLVRSDGGMSTPHLHKEHRGHPRTARGAHPTAPGSENDHPEKSGHFGDFSLFSKASRVLPGTTRGIARIVEGCFWSPSCEHSLRYS